MPKEIKTETTERENEETVELAITDRRMLELIDTLKGRGDIRFTQDFLTEVDIPKQNLWNIKHGIQRFSIQQIENAIKKYKVNANWLFGVEKTVFRVKK